MVFKFTVPSVEFGWQYAPIFGLVVPHCCKNISEGTSSRDTPHERDVNFARDCEIATRRKSKRSYAMERIEANWREIFLFRYQSTTQTETRCEVRPSLDYCVRAKVRAGTVISYLSRDVDISRLRGYTPTNNLPRNADR